MKKLISLCVVGILMIGLLSIAGPVFASDPVDPGPTLEPLTSWKGKHSDELIAAWGKPKKAKRHGEGGKVLVFRLRFFGGEMIGDTVINWGEGDCDSDVYNSVTPRVTATQKVKIYVDAEGIVRGEEFAPRKWKQKP